MTTRRLFAVTLRRLGVFSVSLCADSASGLADDLAALHHERDVLEQAYVVGGVTGDRDQVGVPARLDPPDAVGPPHQLGRVQRGATDRLDRGLAVAHVVGELACVPA